MPSVTFSQPWFFLNAFSIMLYSDSRFKFSSRTDESSDKTFTANHSLLATPIYFCFCLNGVSDFGNTWPVRKMLFWLCHCARCWTQMGSVYKATGWWTWKNFVPTIVSKCTCCRFLVAWRLEIVIGHVIENIFIAPNQFYQFIFIRATFCFNTCQVNQCKTKRIAYFTLFPL